jgi:hypothetical protein
VDERVALEDVGLQEAAADEHRREEGEDENDRVLEPRCAEAVFHAVATYGGIGRPL